MKGIVRLLGGSLRAPLAATLWVTAPAEAGRIDFGLPQLEAEFNTDLRYNVGVRVEQRDERIANNTLFDEGDHLFDRGDVVTNRLDAVSGLTLTYSTETQWIEDFGLRVSGQAFYDFAYRDATTQCRPGEAPVGIPPGLFGPTKVDLSYLDVPGVAARASYCDPEVTAYRDRRFNGKAQRRHLEDIELLDAFVFANLLIGEVPLSIKAGSHSLYWGESLLSPLVGVSYSMGPIDANKGLSVPGVGAQDIFLPLARISATIGLLDQLSLSLDKPLDWKPLRSPEGASYLATADPLFEAPDQIYAGNLPVLGPTSLPNLPSHYADNDDGFGVQLKWLPDFMAGGNLGFYYRRYGEVVPFLGLAPATAERNPGLIGLAGQLEGLLDLLGVPPIGPIPDEIPGGYHLTYAGNTQMWAVSASRQIAGISVGADLVYNVDRALNAQHSYISEDGNGPRGNVWSGVLNGLVLGKKVALAGATLFDSYLLTAELNWSYLDRVTENAQTYKANGSEACQADAVFYWAGEIEGGTLDACSSDYHLGVALLFAPIWYQVFPGIDFAGQLFYSTTLRNNSPIQTAANENFAIGSIGVNATFYSQLNVGLNYNYYDSDFRTGPNFDDEEMVTTFNGAGVVADRDWVSLTFRYSL